MPESPLLPRLDPSLIESELKDLWGRIARETAGSEEEVLRACVLNLVVCSDPDGEVDQLASDLAASGESWSGRLILLVVDEESAGDGFDARVSAHCQRQKGGREQICGEIIRIMAVGEAVSRSASVVAPLVVPDLPVFLWWRRSIDPDAALLQRLARMTDRLIVDSARQGVDDLSAVSSLVALDVEWTVSDLAWARLQLWRRSLAGLYDSALTREVLTRPTGVHLEFGGHLPNEVIYLLSWLAGRLNWELRSSIVETDTGYRVDARAGDANFGIELDRAPGNGLCRVQLSAAGHLTVDVERRRSSGSLLEIRVECQGRRISHQVLPGTSQREIELLATELEIPQRDRVFQEALAFASRLRYLQDAAPE